MNRPDLHSTFTKITLWKQIQFRRIVYMDADMVALRAPDELFNLPEPFSAAPDIGWPDLFNTGLMVLNPNMGDYYALLAMATRGISFDGADQGLLNMHFKNSYNRLSFTYNVTPSAHYQYLPAYRHFQSSISAAHFIGTEKPWTQGREASRGLSPYDELAGRWWAVYDRHYRQAVCVPLSILVLLLTHRQSATISGQGQGVPAIIQYHVKGEYQPPSYGYSSSSQYSSTQTSSAQEPPQADNTRDISSVTTQQPFHGTSQNTQQITEAAPQLTQEEKADPRVTNPVEEKKEFIPPFNTWDPAR